MPVSSLTSLPTELVLHIIEGLYQDDLLAVRMTCKRFNGLAREPHLQSIYRIRNLHSVPVSIWNLSKISGSRMNIYVRHLRVTPDSPYIEEDDELFAALGVDPSKLDLIPDERDYEMMLDVNAIKGELREIFKRLPNIETIEFVYQNQISSHWDRQQFNTFFPSAGFSPGNKFPRNLPQKSRRLIQEFPDLQIWETVMTAALKSDLKNWDQVIERRRDDKGRRHGLGIPLRWFLGVHANRAIDFIRPGRKGLKVLEIQLSWKADMWSEGRTHVAYMQGCNSWIETVGPGLEELRLIHRSIPADLVDLPILPRLKVLGLEGYRLSLDTWKQLMSRYPELEEVELECWFTNPAEWYFQALSSLYDKGYTGPKNLRRISFHNFSGSKLKSLNMGDIKDLGFERVILPKLILISGDWASRQSICKSFFDICDSGIGQVCFDTPADIFQDALNCYEGAGNLMKTITHGQWMDPDGATWTAADDHQMFNALIGNKLDWNQILEEMPEKSEASLRWRWKYFLGPKL